MSRTLLRGVAIAEFQTISEYLPVVVGDLEGLRYARRSTASVRRSATLIQPRSSSAVGSIS